MAIEKGALASVAESLSAAYDDALSEDQKDRLSRAFPEAAQDGYESAGESTDERAALIKAAADGDVSGQYATFYRQNPDIRNDLASAGESAFDDRARDMISDEYGQRGVTEAYQHCSRGNFDAAGEAINSNINPSSANECRRMVQQEAGMAKELFNAFQEEDSNEVYVPGE